jgi:hypothetical protein
MGQALITTLDNVAHRTRAAPLLDWLWATCLRLGPNAVDRQRSLLDQGFNPTAPDARVVKWMQKKLTAYRLPTIPSVASVANAMATPGAPTLAGGLPTPAGEKEYSQLQTDQIQAACDLTNAQWDTDLPQLSRI